MLQRINLTSYAVASFIQNVGKNHSRAKLFVAKALLDCSDIITGINEVVSEGMLEGMVVQCGGAYILHNQ